MKRYFEQNYIDITLVLLLAATLAMGFAAPFVFMYVMPLVVAISAYLMHRVSVLLPLAFLLIFAAASLLWGAGYAFGYFTPLALIASLGLYYALKQPNYRKGALVAAFCAIGAAFVTAIFLTLVSGANSFADLVADELLRGGDPIMLSSARSYFRLEFPTDAERAAFAELHGLTESAAALNVFAEYMRRAMNSDLLYYLMLTGTASGLGGYLIANVLVRRLLLPSYSRRPQVPVAKEITIDQSPITEMTLPKRFFAAMFLLALVLWALAQGYKPIAPFYNAVFIGFLITPFGMSGMCFMLFLTTLPREGLIKIPLTALVCAIIALAAVFVDILTFFAILGLADYFLNTRRIIKIMLEIK